MRKLNVFSQKNKSKQRGVTLIEFGIVMLLLAIVLGLAAVGLTARKHRISVNDNTSAIIDTAEAIKAKYGSVNRYGTISTANAVTSGLIPNEYQDGAGATTATNKFGGAITVLPGANGTAVLTWPAVPREECSNIVTGVESRFRQVQVGGVDVKALDQAIVDNTLEAQCTAATASTLTLFVGRT